MTGGAILSAVITAMLAALCGVWFLEAGLVFKRLSELLTLVDLDPADPVVWPRVSAIVPGRDEAASIGAALATRLGKLNALEQGTRAATGEWLLISDADIHFERGTLRKTVAFCEEQGRDFLALVPEFRSQSFAVNVVWATFIRILAMSLSPAAIRDPESSASAGSGSFMLMRRSVYDAR